MADFEEVHHTTLSSTHFRRLGCFVHTLQLVVNSSVLSSNTTVKKAKKMVGRCNKSCKITEQLLEKTGKNS